MAEKTGLSDGYISLVEADRRQPSAAAIKLLGGALAASEDWIRTGQGEMSTASSGVNTEDRTADKETASGKIAASPAVRDLLRPLEPYLEDHRLPDLPKQSRKLYEQRVRELIAWVGRELEEYRKLLLAQHLREPARRRTDAKRTEH